MVNHEELRALVAGFRAAVERSLAQGAVGAPARPSARIPPPAATVPDAPERPATGTPRPGATDPDLAEPGVVAADLFAAAQAVPRGAEGLRAVRERLGDCRRCKLCEGRTQIVFGVGNAEADLAFVGEGPGRDEDLQGEPFVGPAGQLLTRMIAAMGLGREDVYICNVVKCRPPRNRNPQPDEVAACEPFLAMQIEAIRPKLIVALGNFAVQTLLETRAGIGSLRGRFHPYRGIPLMPTFHPAFLLRSPHMKKQAWEDLQKVMAEMDRLGLARART
jgi:DNA polymerase